MSRRIDDTRWSKLYKRLRLIPGIYSGNEEKCRTFVDGVYWIMRTGAPWRDLPANFGQWNSIYNRFADWSDKGVWQAVFDAFADEPDMEWLLLDSSVIRAHPCAAGAPTKEKVSQEVETTESEDESLPNEQPEREDTPKTEALGRSRGGFSTKVHVAVDALGYPVRFILTGGQANDSTQAIPLLEGFDFGGVMADRAYDTDDILEFIAQKKANIVIPSKKNRLVQRDTDWYTYKERNLVECFINKIKQYRRIFTRFEKYASRYMAFLAFAAALIWLT